MVSFQWITLSFLLVSGALFAYLIPLLAAHIRHLVVGSEYTDYDHSEIARSYIGKDHTDIFGSAG